MTAPDRTTDALASALPEAISYPIQMTDGVVDVRWHTREIATFQAERLAEAGYVLVHTAPDGATIERLAEAGARGEGMDWDELTAKAKSFFRDNVRAVLVAQRDVMLDVSGLNLATVRALAGTSAQARHTDGDTTGGGAS